MTPDAVHESFNRYTQEVLAWNLGQPEYSVLREDGEQARRTAGRAARVHAASKRPWLLLLGLGDGTLARMLCGELPSDRALIILETEAERVRRVWPELRRDCGAQRFALLADSSIWALFLLARAAGMDAENATLCRNPASSSTELLTWQRLFLESRTERLEPAATSLPLSVACMLHPEEPDLEDFFGHMPPWLHEVCVLWDGAAPSVAFSCQAPVRQSCRPLDAHFGEQRNAMLALCRTEWCLCLDADERLSSRTWELLPYVLAAPELGGVLFPRQTFEGDEEHVRMGYGLWPDVQLRLLRKNAALRFEGAVHETVEGLEGRLALAADMPLLHYSHVRKDSRSLQRRLEVFNRAAGEERHRLSESYPRLPRAFFHHMDAAFAGRLIMLPTHITAVKQTAQA
ncbi:MAG: glycosyl transferase family 2 [Desulfovibrionaceae bacterium]|nr:glycosyl transferase family 2 [Desulfovibrionaceae bacterium]